MFENSLKFKILLCIIVMDCIKWLFMHIGHNWLIFYYTKSVVQYFLNNEDVKSRQISKAMTTDNNLDSRTSRKSFSGIFSYEFNDLKFHWFVINVKSFFSTFKITVIYHSNSNLYITSDKWRITNWVCFVFTWLNCTIKRMEKQMIESFICGICEPTTLALYNGQVLNFR